MDEPWPSGINNVTNSKNNKLIISNVFNKTLNKVFGIVIVGLLIQIGAFVIPTSTPVHAIEAAGESWRLPITAGTQVTLDQGYFGGFSHNAPGSEYALDIQGDGMEIAAAKSGRIQAIRHGGHWNQWCNSNTDCINKGGIWRGNHIEILHDDGSVSLYLHMRGGSIPSNLYVGAPVMQGQIIGLTGFTGYTCSLLYPNCSVPDPHIHFEVRKNGYSIPTTFEDCKYHSNPCENGAPVAYRWYTSINTHPYEIRDFGGSKIRLKESGLGMKLGQNLRGSYLTAGLADQGSNFRLVNGSIRGPQNWCVDTLKGSLPVTVNDELVLRDCNTSPTQRWDQQNGAIYILGTPLCIAPFASRGADSLEKSLKLENCPNFEYKWGELGKFTSSSITRLSRMESGTGEIPSQPSEKETSDYSPTNQTKNLINSGHNDVSYTSEYHEMEQYLEQESTRNQFVEATAGKFDFKYNPSSLLRMDTESSPSNVISNSFPHAQPNQIKESVYTLQNTNVKHSVEDVKTGVETNNTGSESIFKQELLNNLSTIQSKLRARSLR